MRLPKTEGESSFPDYACRPIITLLTNDMSGIKPFDLTAGEAQAIEVGIMKKMCTIGVKAHEPLRLRATSARAMRNVLEMYT